MRPKTNICVLDTETVGGAIRPTGVYNLGFVISQMTTGKELCRHNILIREHYDKIKDDDYAKKNWDKYQKWARERSVLIVDTEWQAINLCRTICKGYNVTYLSAYNSGFDFGKTKCRVLLKDFQFIDIYLMALQTVTHLKKYRRFCIDNGYLTPKGRQCSTTAEAVYAFITNNKTYQEEHTALSDALIEKEIFDYCLKMHKKYTKNCHNFNCKDRASKCFPKP